jgi:hypothetical protein
MACDFAKDQTGSFLLSAVLSGLFAGVALFFTLSNLEFSSFGALVFAGLVGGTLGAFVYRERSLEQRCEEYRWEVARLEERMHHYYEESLACLACFETESLLTEKVSPGFLQLFRIPPGLEVRGKSIVELLQVSAVQFESIVAEAKRTTARGKSFQLLAEDAKGCQLPVEITLKYLKSRHMIEAAFFVASTSAGKNLQQVDVAPEDLDRFRRGMYRRETRILELKEEINWLLRESGQGPRYRFDQKTQDVNLVMGKDAESREER